MAESASDLQELTVDELTDRAKSAGVSGYSSMRKKELAKAVARAERDGDSSSGSSGSSSSSSGSSSSSSSSGSGSGGSSSSSSGGSDGGSSSDGGSQSDTNESSSRRRRRKTPAAGRIAQAAMMQMQMLTGKPIMGVLEIDKLEDGWRVVVEVAELKRIPDSTDVLASYETELDSDGELQSYRRMRRYIRAQPDEF